MEDMSNQNSGEEEWSKAKYGGHLLDEARSETEIGVKSHVPATFTVEDENEGMDWNAQQQVFWMVELLSNILSYLPTCDIKSCNGLSSLWRQEARKLLLLRTRMDFGSGGQDVQHQVDSYIEEMGDNCHQSMSIHSLGNGDAERLAITRLGNKYGYKIKKLYMTMGNPNILQSYTNITMLSVSLDLDNFINIPQDLIIPSVKTLSFRVTQPQTLIKSLETSLHELTQSQSAFELWKWKASLFNHEVEVMGTDVKTGFVQSLLRMCPMMEHLDLDGAAQTPFLRHFETSEHYCRTIPNQLSSLALNGSSLLLRSPSLRLLNSLGALRLTMLKIDFYGMDDNLGLPPPSIPALQKILAAFAPTLKHFKLHRIPFRPIGITESTVTFPEMPKLETLGITHISVPLPRFIFGDGTAHGIDYSLQFPVLKKFQIKSVDGEESCVDGSLRLCEMFFPKGTLPCPTLTRIDVDCISGIKHGDNCEKEDYCLCNKEGPVWNMLKRLITMFPNVEEFKKCGGWQW